MYQGKRSNINSCVELWSMGSCDSRQFLCDFEQNNSKRSKHLLKITQCWSWVKGNKTTDPCYLTWNYLFVYECSKYNLWRRGTLPLWQRHQMYNRRSLCCTRKGKETAADFFIPNPPSLSSSAAIECLVDRKLSYYLHQILRFGVTLLFIDFPSHRAHWQTKGIHFVWNSRRQIYPQSW